jgi:hypothetical protein
MSGHVQTSLPRARALPVPVPEPVPEPEITTTTPSATTAEEERHEEILPDKPSVQHARPTAKNQIDLDIDHWFQQDFWPIYWRKVAKEDALKAARKNCRTVEIRQAALEAVRRETPAMMAREPEKRPHGATWLNGRRWTDEPDPPQLALSPGSVKPFDREALHAQRVSDTFDALMADRMDRNAR